MKPEVDPSILTPTIDPKPLYLFTPDEVKAVLWRVFKDGAQEIEFKAKDSAGNYFFIVTPNFFDEGELDLDSETFKELEAMEEGGVFEIEYKAKKFFIKFMRNDLERRVMTSYNENIKHLEKLTGKRVMLEDNKPYGLRAAINNFLNTPINKTNNNDIEAKKIIETHQNVLLNDAEEGRNTTFRNIYNSDKEIFNDLSGSLIDMFEILYKVAMQVSVGVFTESVQGRLEVKKDNLVVPLEQLIKKLKEVGLEIGLDRGYITYDKNKKDAILTELLKYFKPNSSYPLIRVLSENKDYTASYPNPTLESQSFVMLSLAVGQAKFHEPDLNNVGRLPEVDEDKMIEVGVQVLRGKKNSKQYVNELFSIFKKITGKKKLNEEDFMRNQIELRIDGNKSPVTNKNLKEGEQKEKAYQFGMEVPNYMTDIPELRMPDPTLTGDEQPIQEKKEVLNEMAYDTQGETRTLDFLRERDSKGATADLLESFVYFIMKPSTLK